jgi:hypothetical protein
LLSAGAFMVSSERAIIFGPFDPWRTIRHRVLTR